MQRRRRLIILSGAIIFLVAVASVFLYASFSRPVNEKAIRLQQHRVSNPCNHQMIDSGIQLLHSGDIVLRTGADITSYMFTQMNLYNKTYSHCGIVRFEGGYPFIYHSIGGEDNPDQIIKRDSAALWFSPLNNLGFGIVRYNVDKEKLQSISATALRFYNERRKFDMDFDLRTDNKLYCAEFVYKAINYAMSDSLFVTPSVMFGRRFVAPDNLFLNRAASFVWQVRYK